MTPNKPFTKEEFVAMFEDGDLNCECCDRPAAKKIWEYIKKAQADVAQQCYLECLGEEGGHGGCAEAISSEFPDLVSKCEDEDD